MKRNFDVKFHYVNEKKSDLKSEFSQGENLGWASDVVALVENPLTSTGLLKHTVKMCLETEGQDQNMNGQYLDIEQ